MNTRLIIRLERYDQHARATDFLPLLAALVEGGEFRGADGEAYVSAYSPDGHGSAILGQNLEATIWVRDDVRSRALDEGHSEADADRIADAVLDSRGWRNVSDCTESDWCLIDLLIEEAVKSLGIPEP